MLEDKVTDAKTFYTGLALIECNYDVEAAKRLEPHRTLAKLVNEVELSNDEQDETDEEAEIPEDDRIHAAVLATLMNKQELRAKYESKDYPDFTYPKNFLERR